MGDSIWVACSGGVDSIAIAHYLVNKLKREVKLFHYNHNLRPQNNKMEAAVAKFAGDYDLELSAHSHSFPATSENEMRSNRYLALQRIVRVGDCITCHHLNDCVESYLMNCFNGVGDYCPIPICTKFGFTNVIRPFLLTPKRVLEKYAAHHNLYDYIVEDETNCDTKYRRNWVRHRAIPMIEEEYPGLEKVVFKKMKQEYDRISYRDRMTDPSGYVWEGK